MTVVLTMMMVVVDGSSSAWVLLLRPGNMIMVMVGGSGLYLDYGWF